MARCPSPRSAVACSYSLSACSREPWSSSSRARSATAAPIRWRAARLPGLASTNACRSRRPPRRVAGAEHLERLVEVEAVAVVVGSRLRARRRRAIATLSSIRPPWPRDRPGCASDVAGRSRAARCGVRLRSDRARARAASPALARSRSPAAIAADCRPATARATSLVDRGARRPRARACTHASSGASNVTICHCVGGRREVARLLRALRELAVAGDRLRSTRVGCTRRATPAAAGAGAVRSAGICAHPREQREHAPAATNALSGSSDRSTRSPCART